MAGPVRSVIVLPTLSCMMRCRMCRHWDLPLEKEPIGPRLVAKLAQEVAAFTRESGAGTRDVSFIFGGGEPLLRAETVVEGIAACRKNGLRTCLATNGFLLDASLLTRLSAAGLDSLGMSLDSSECAVHDFLRGVDGSHQKVMDALGWLASSQAGIRVTLNATIMAPTLEGLRELVRFADGRGVVAGVLFQAVLQPFNTPPEQSWQSHPGYCELWPDNVKAAALIDELIVMKRAGSKIDNPEGQLVSFKAYFNAPGMFIKKLRCNAAESGFCTVGPDGEVHLCPCMEPVGNLRSRGFREIWDSPAAEEVRRAMKGCRRNCHHLVNCWYEEEPADG